MKSIRKWFWSRMDHDNAPPELIDPLPCDCCGVLSSYRRGSMWHGRHLICLPCFHIWYDPPSGCDPTNAADIKKVRLRQYGQRDFRQGEMVPLPTSRPGPDWPADR